MEEWTVSIEAGNVKPLRVSVTGAGAMGHGLALLLARAGHHILLMDISAEILDRANRLIRSHLGMLSETGQMDASMIDGIMGRIHTATGLEALKDADLVIESISEDTGIKRAFYEEAAKLCSPDAIIASNTSYLNIFELAPASLQQRLLISHFFAPPYLIPLVEIVKGPETLAEVAEVMFGILERADQRPIIMDKFIPGFIVNRLQRAIGREIFHLMDGGYAKPEQIDKAVLASLGVRLPVLGVVRRYDFAGLDFALKVLSNPSIGLVNEDGPSRTLENLVSAGNLGVKTGKGFYDYGGQDLEKIYLKRDKLLIRMRKFIDEIENELWLNNKLSSES